MTLRSRITFLFAILSGVIISLLSGFVWYFANEFAFEDFYKMLKYVTVISNVCPQNRNIW
jgi:hypothetical protein